MFINFLEIVSGEVLAKLRGTIISLKDFTLDKRRNNVPQSREKKETKINC